MSIPLFFYCFLSIVGWNFSQQETTAIWMRTLFSHSTLKEIARENLKQKCMHCCQVPACVCSLVLRWKFFECGISWARLWSRSRGLWKHSIVWGVSYFDLCAFQIQLTHARSSVAVCLLLLSARNFTSCSTLSYTSVQLATLQWPILPDFSF